MEGVKNDMKNLGLLEHIIVDKVTEKADLVVEHR